MIDEGVESFLSHYGVKGMKWGVRRERKRQAKRDRYNAMTSRQKQQYTRKKNSRKRAVKTAAAVGALYGAVFAASLATSYGIDFIAGPKGREALKKTAQAYRSYRNPTVEDILRKSGNLVVNKPTNVIDVGLATWPKL